MARHFTRASVESLVFSLGAMTAFPWGTVAAVFRITIAFTAGTYGTLFSTDAAGDDALGVFLDGDNGARFSTYNGTGAAVVGATSGQGLAVADSWVCCAWTKTTGTQTPRLHRYRWSAGDWVHGAGSGTTPDPALTVTQIRIGTNHTNGDALDGDIVAVMFAPKLVLDDTAIERLPSGRWGQIVDLGAPGFLCEFPSGHDQPLIGAARDLSRSGARNSAMTGTSRTNVPDPPGFRFSRLTRRQ